MGTVGVGVHVAFRTPMQTQTPKTNDGGGDVSKKMSAFERDHFLLQTQGEKAHSLLLEHQRSGIPTEFFSTGDDDDHYDINNQGGRLTPYVTRVALFDPASCVSNGWFC